MDASRTINTAPFDAWIAGKTLDRLADVVAERQGFTSQALVPEAATEFSGGIDQPIRLFTPGYQYGACWFLEMDHEAHFLDVAQIVDTEYADVNIRWEAYCADGNYHPLAGDVTNPTKYSAGALGVASGDTVYEFDRLDLQPVIESGSRRFVLCCFANAEKDGVSNDYFIVSLVGEPPGRGQPGAWSIPVTGLADPENDGNQFSTDFGEQPVEIAWLHQVQTGAGGFAELTAAETGEFDVNRVWSAGLKTNYRGYDLIFLEPYTSIERIKQDATLTTGTPPFRYYPDRKVRCFGMGEARISATSFQFYNEINNADWDAEFRDFAVSSPIFRSPSQAKAAFSPGKTPRYANGALLLYGTGEHLFTQRTPIFAAHNQDHNLMRHEINSDSSTYFLYEEPVERFSTGNDFLYQGDAATYQRLYCDMQFQWVFRMNTPEPFLLDVVVQWLDSTGGATATETYQGALEVGTTQEFGVQERDNGTDINVGSVGYFGRVYQASAGWFDEATVTYSSDKPHRFKMVVDRLGLKFGDLQTFQATLLIPALAETMRVFIKPRVEAGFFDDYLGRRNNFFLVLGHQERITTRPSWNSLSS